MKDSVRYIILFSVLFNCSCNDIHVQSVVTADTVALQEKFENVKLKLFTGEEVARYAIASVMGHDPKTIQVKRADDIYYATYVRGDVYYIYKVMFKGHQVLWAVRDGRWRNSDADEKITFKEERGKLKIIQTFTDGTQSVDVYGK